MTKLIGLSVTTLVWLALFTAAPAYAAAQGVLEGDPSGVAVTDYMGALANLGAVGLLGLIGREFFKGRIQIRDLEKTEARLEAAAAALHKTAETAMEREARATEREAVYQRLLFRKLGMDDEGNPTE